MPLFYFRKDNLVIKAMQSTGRILTCHVNYNSFKSADSRNTSGSDSYKGTKNENTNFVKSSDIETFSKKR